MQEIWKPIEGYEGRYEISNLGRVKSNTRKMKGKIVPGSINAHGYRMVKLTDECGKERTFTIHRLAADAFIENPSKLPHVNHKDENKLNNCVVNLEWCDNAYNMNYGTRNKRIAEANCCNSKRCKPVVSIAENGEKEWFPGINEAGRRTGNPPGNIVKALQGLRSHCGNRQWFYC